MKGYTFREAKKLMKANNLLLVRQKGDHAIFSDINNQKTISIPIKSKNSNEISRPLMQRLIKQFNLKEI